jgi:hypothetical protein
MHLVGREYVVAMHPALCKHVSCSHFLVSYICSIFIVVLLSRKISDLLLHSYIYLICWQY